eukprot:Phypoly_transcript_21711.p1 GENE.Phypoly_transcript_21711~~Phypoly_transcript_21711.p1  ORF type:complete len:123 (+),score=16.22 Phypoly_transcript_21711:94-462(+)
MTCKLWAIVLVCSLIVCQAQQYSIYMDVNEPSGKTQTITLPWYPSLTLFNAMVQMVTYTNQNFTFDMSFASAQYGGFVTSINGIDNTETLYWLYSVNGQQAQVGVGEYQTNVGDKIVWEYTK